MAERYLIVYGSGTLGIDVVDQTSVTSPLLDLALPIRIWISSCRARSHGAIGNNARKLGGVNDRRHTGERRKVITDLARRKAALEASGFKRCNLCDEVLPTADFNFFPKRGVKRPFWCCKKCKIERDKDLRSRGCFRERDLRFAKRRAVRYPEKKKAQNAVVTALRKGTLVRPIVCETCGANPPPFRGGKAAIEAHHPDYRKPLLVMWLCHSCHKRIHRANS